MLLLWAFVVTSGLSLATVLLRREPDAGELLRLAGEKDRELVLALADRPFDHLKQILQILQILLPAQTILRLGDWVLLRLAGAGGGVRMTERSGKRT